MAPPSTPEKYPPSDAFDEVVEINVGLALRNTQKSFKVCKGVLCFYSGYFDAAFNGQFKESTNGVVELKTEDPSIFQNFQYWLYTRRFSAEGHSKKVLYSDLIKLWVFGDAHSIPLLQNEAANMLLKKMLTEWHFPATELEYIYKNTLAGSALRRLMLDFVAKTASQNILSKEESNQRWCKEALLDLVRLTWTSTVGMQTKAEVAKWDVCQYHVHEEGVNCNAALK